MNFFRLSGWRAGSCDTCSADTTVPCTTSTSSSASSTCFANCSTRCGVSDAHAVTPPALISRMRCADELGLDRLGVELLHPARRLLGRQRRDLLEDRVGILVARPEPFEVQAREPAEPADLDRGRGRDDTVHRGRHHRQLELVRVDLPRDVDVLGIARAPARHDRDVVEPVGPASRLADPDLDFHSSSGLSCGSPRNLPGYPSPARELVTPSRTRSEGGDAHSVAVRGMNWVTRYAGRRSIAR